MFEAGIATPVLFRYQAYATIGLLVLYDKTQVTNDEHFNSPLSEDRLCPFARR